VCPSFAHINLKFIQLDLFEILFEVFPKFVFVCENYHAKSLTYLKTNVVHAFPVHLWDRSEFPRFVALIASNVLRHELLGKHIEKIEHFLESIFSLIEIILGLFIFINNHAGIFFNIEIVGYFSLTFIFFSLINKGEFQFAFKGAGKCFQNKRNSFFIRKVKYFWKSWVRVDEFEIVLVI